MIEGFLEILAEMFDNDALVMSLFAGCLSLSAIGFIVYAILQNRAAVSRRVATDGEESRAGAASIDLSRDTGPVARYITKFADQFGEPEARERKMLRHRLARAGLFAPGAAAWFIAARIALVPVFAAAGFFLGAWWSPDGGPAFLGGAALVGGACGYLAPVKWLDRRIATRCDEHRAGFPDFMDLMVVCCQAGLSMEAAISRVAKELVVAYPSLARNLEMGTMELRGGLALSKMVDALSKRLGIPEAVSFSTLLQQSEELGSSLTQSLRAYSDDMRNKRLMAAEEKAHALPAKLVIPLTLFVFPVLMVVIMLPVVIGVAEVRA